MFGNKLGAVRCSMVFLISWWLFYFTRKVQTSTSSNNYFIKLPKRGAIFNHLNQLIIHAFSFKLKCYESNVPLLQFSPQLLQSPIKQPSKRRDPLFPRQRTTKGPQPWSLSINGMDEFKRSVIESSSNTGIVSVVRQRKRNRVRINDRCLV